MVDNLTSLPVLMIPPALAAEALDTAAEEVALSFYDQTPSQMRARILREEGGTVPFERGTLDRLMERLQLRGNVLASALRFHESVVTYYRSGRIPLPRIVYESLAGAADEKEAVLLLRRNIAQAMARRSVQQSSNEQALQADRLLENKIKRLKESKWPEVYREAPSFFRSQILRGESEITSVRGAGPEFRRLLKHLGLGVKETAEFLGLSEAAVKFYGNDSSSIPGRILLALKRANNKAEALQYLSDMIAKAMAVFVDRVPHYQDLFELHRLLQKQGVHLDSFLGRVQYRDLNSETVTAVIAILKLDASLASKQQAARALFLPAPVEKPPAQTMRVKKTERHRVPAFFIHSADLKILREALHKFGVSKPQLAGLLGIGTGRLYVLISGQEPISKKLKLYVQAMAEEKSLIALQARIAKLNETLAFMKAKRGKGFVPMDEQEFRRLVWHRTPHLQRHAFRALQKFRLASLENAKDITQEVLMELHHAMMRGTIFDGQKMMGWLAVVIKARTFNFFLQSRGLAKHDAKFYFRMRDLMRVHANKTGCNFAAEDLQTFDLSLSLEDAQANMERFEELERLLREDISMEDLSPAMQARF